MGWNRPGTPTSTSTSAVLDSDQESGPSKYWDRPPGPLRPLEDRSISVVCASATRWRPGTRQMIVDFEGQPAVRPPIILVILAILVKHPSKTPLAEKNERLREYYIQLSEDLERKKDWNENDFQVKKLSRLFIFRSSAFSLPTYIRCNVIPSRTFRR